MVTFPFASAMKISYLSRFSQLVRNILDNSIPGLQIMGEVLNFPVKK